MEQGLVRPFAHYFWLWHFAHGAFCCNTVLFDAAVLLFFWLWYDFAENGFCHDSVERVLFLCAALLWLLWFVVWNAWYCGSTGQDFVPSVAQHQPRLRWLGFVVLDAQCCEPVESVLAALFLEFVVLTQLLMEL